MQNSTVFDERFGLEERLYCRTSARHRGNPLILDEFRTGFFLWVILPPIRVDGAWLLTESNDELFLQELAKFLPRLRRAARAKAATFLNPGVTADEVISDAYEQAWKNRHQWSGKNFVAWFLTIFDHCLADEGRRRKRNRIANPAEVERQTEEPDLHASAAFEGVIARDTITLIRRHVTEGQWEAARLVLILDYTNAEAAEILEIPEGTVKSRVHAFRQTAEGLIVR